MQSYYYYYFLPARANGSTDPILVLNKPKIIIIIYFIVIVIFIWCNTFIPSRNLDEVFTYNHIRLYFSFEATLMLRHQWF